MAMTGPLMRLGGYIRPMGFHAGWSHYQEVPAKRGSFGNCCVALSVAHVPNTRFAQSLAE
jgi:hypothetical protein